MRVTSGKFKGRKLLDNKFDHIRPTADMVKQALFNKLGQKIAGSAFLDLFCGSGAIGIEAISRGADKVVFVDRDVRSVNLTKANLNNLGIEAPILKLDYKKALQSLKDQSFDVIFVDPPYKSGVYEEVLKLIEQLNLLKQDGVIVCEQDRLNQIQTPSFFEFDVKYYGTKKLSFFEKANF